MTKWLWTGDIANASPGRYAGRVAPARDRLQHAVRERVPRLGLVSDSGGGQSNNRGTPLHHEGAEGKTAAGRSLPRPLHGVAQRRRSTLLLGKRPRRCPTSPMA